MKTITREDINELKKEFDKYTETAEQSQFMMLFMVDQKLQATINQLETNGSLNNEKDIQLETEEGQKEARAMFRIVYRTIGQLDKAVEYSEV